MVIVSVRPAVPFHTNAASSFSHARRLQHIAKRHPHILILIDIRRQFRHSDCDSRRAGCDPSIDL